MLFGKPAAIGDSVRYGEGAGEIDRASSLSISVVFRKKLIFIKEGSRVDHESIVMKEDFEGYDRCRRGSYRNLLVLLLPLTIDKHRDNEQMTRNKHHR